MELDELKQAWKDTSSTKTKNTDIMDIIQHKSYGPVEALKNAFRKQIIFMATIPFVFIATNAQNIRGVFTSILFWSYVAFCIGIIVLAGRNLLIAKKMEVMDGQVKINLQQQVQVLEQRMKWQVLTVRVALFSFIVLVEAVPYLQHYRMLDKWHSLSPFIRFGAYASFALFQYFMNKRITERKIGRHLKYLKSLVNELHD